jgi:hypothetical protein
MIPRGRKARKSLGLRFEGSPPDVLRELSRHFIAGTNGIYWAKNQQRKKTSGIWTII